jgi:hypothetical protein
VIYEGGIGLAGNLMPRITPLPSGSLGTILPIPAETISPAYRFNICKHFRTAFTCAFRRNNGDD